MRKAKLGIVAILLSTLAGCYVEARHPCHMDCFWHDGHKVCEKRC